MYHSHEVNIGNIIIGNSNRVAVQSMTSTSTLTTDGTIEQITELCEAGCDIVRLTTQSLEEVHKFKLIKQELRSRGYNIPLVADVHFNPKIAELVSEYADKVRINPGNYYSSFDRKNELLAIEENIIPLIESCEKFGTAIRVGVNHGSLSDRILQKYGNTPLALVESLIEFVEIFNRYKFKNLVLSIKASNVKIMIEANLLLVDRLIRSNYTYPIHLGVTEAGSGIDARVKSSIGIGYLLAHNIGDTIRVSLTENPVKEIITAKMLVNNFGLRKIIKPNVIADCITINKRDTQNESWLVVSDKKSDFSDVFLMGYQIIDKNDVDEIKLYKFDFNNLQYQDLTIIGSVHIAIKIINENSGAVFIDNNITTCDQKALLIQNILQSLGYRFFKAEFISCPTCGRAKNNIELIANQVKKSMSHLTGISIAIMGCIVNGPGEMREANYGILSSVKNKVSLYKDGLLIKRNINIKGAVKELKQLIKDSGDWKE